MARSPTTFDAFAAIAEPKRRQILEALGGRRMRVTQLVVELGWPQPMVSKHLAVLREVGLLHAERQSREMIYRVEPGPLKAIHAWAQQFEQLWDTHLHRIKRRAEVKVRTTNPSERSLTEKEK